MDRFNRMSVKIKDLSDEIAIHHFSYDLPLGVFDDEVSHKPPKMMEEFRERAIEFTQMEDMQNFRAHNKELEPSMVVEKNTSKSSN